MNQLPEVVLTGNHHKIVFTAPSKQLRSEVKLYSFLRNVVEAINCKIVAGPLVATIKESDLPLSSEVEQWFDDGGISGVVILSTSHVAAHFWTQERYGVIDVYSCKPYELNALLAVLRTDYNVGALKVLDLSYSVNGEVKWLNPEYFERRV